MKSTKLKSGATLYAQEYNALRSDAVPASWLHAHQQLGALSLGTNPTNGQTVTFVVNSTSIVLTGKTGSLVNPGDFAIQGSAAATCAVIFAALQDITTTTTNFVGLNGSATPIANAILMQYVGFGYAAGTTVITPYSLNKSTYAPLTSFNITTTVSSGSWTAQTMQLYVEPGTYYISGIRYFFLGGSTGTVTAPSSHPRIDVLSIDTSGTLAWITGSENASPVAPTYPANKIPICELYNVTGETALYDVDNQQAGSGYISADVRPMVQNGIPFAAVPDDIIPDATDTRSLGSGSYEWLNVYAKNIYTGGNPVAVAQFGGTGADGALSISSGTTTIDCANAAVVVKNYTSINITGTGVLAFSNPNTNGTIIVLKSQGNVTLTSSATPMIDASGMGASSANNGQGTESIVANTGNNGGGGGTGAQGGATASMAVFYPLNIAGKRIRIMPGAGGGAGANSNNGGAGTAAGGAGGNGGGGLLVECNGALNFTTANGISIAGLVGTAGTNGGNDQGGGGGGGGGAGGTCAILYRSLTSASGTITLSGGGGGIGGNKGGNSSGFTSAGGGGGAGGSNLYAGGTGGNAGGSSSGNATSGGNGGGSSGGTGASGGNSNGAPGASKSPGGGGGGGATGASYVVANTEFS